MKVHQTTVKALSLQPRATLCLQAVYEGLSRTTHDLITASSQGTRTRTNGMTYLRLTAVAHYSTTTKRLSNSTVSSSAF